MMTMFSFSSPACDLQTSGWEGGGITQQMNQRSVNHPADVLEAGLQSHERKLRLSIKQKEASARRASILRSSGSSINERRCYSGPLPVANPTKVRSGNSSSERSQGYSTLLDLAFFQDTLFLSLYTLAHIYTRTYIHRHTHTHTRTHAHTHTLTHNCTPTHTPAHTQLN